MFTMAVSIISGVMVIVGFLSMIIKPIRAKLLKDEEKEKAEKAKDEMLKSCICDTMRDRIIALYEKNKRTEQLSYYERDSLDRIFKSYSTLGGNSYAHDLYEEMRTWAVDNGR